ncbi:MAG: hypothetical protein R3C19_01680 [Planctomycetaceae bacterium]
MVSTSDPSTLDLVRTRVALRPSVRFVPQVYGNETFYHIEDAATGNYYRIGYTEYVFVSLLDGKTTFSEALAITAQTQSATALPQQQAMSLYCWLLENNLADIDETSVARSRTGDVKAGRRKPFLARFNPFWFRIPLGRPDAALKALQPVLGWLFSVRATVLAVLMMAAAVIAVGMEWDRFRSASVAVFAPDNWLWLLLSWIGLKCAHETAHGLTCHRYGGSVRDSGIILAFLAPLAYVDVTSSWGFSSRWQRIHVAVAGMYIELLLASLAVFGWLVSESAVVSHVLYNVIVMASLSTILFNANPLMKFDGYYILSDLLQTPNLQAQSSQAVSHSVSRVLFGVRATAPASLGRSAWLLRIYGVAAMLWRVVVTLTLLIAGSVLFHGAGLLLSVLGALAWFGAPVWNAARSANRLWSESPARLVRGAILAGTIVALATTALFGMPCPFVATAPGIVELPEGAAVRAGTDGFIRQIHVQTGQAVEEGTLLLTLENQQVRADHADLQIQIQQETIRLQSAIEKHDAGRARVARGNLTSLADRLSETARQVAHLEVRATTSGRVLARDLRARLDTFVREGDELLSIDIGKPREFRVSISQNDFPLAHSRIGDSLAVRIGTRGRFRGVLQRLTPRASRRLPAESLAATAGGPLPVTSSQEPDSRDSRQELTTERFDAVVALPPETADFLNSGERGYVSLGLRDESVASHLNYQFRGWLKDKLRLAKLSQ